jgi:hypothetical protein
MKELSESYAIKPDYVESLNPKDKDFIFFWLFDNMVKYLKISWNSSKCIINMVSFEIILNIIRNIILNLLYFVKFHKQVQIPLHLKPPFFLLNQ